MFYRINLENIKISIFDAKVDDMFEGKYLLYNIAFRKINILAQIF